MISSNLSLLRKLNGYSQEDVAEKVGVSRQAVAKWESGETTPDLENASALAAFYHVTLDDLVNHSSEKKRLSSSTQGKARFWCRHCW